MAGRYVTQVELRTNIEKVLEGLKETQDRVDKLEEKDYKINLGIDTKTLESAIQKLDKMLDSLGKGTGDFKQLEDLSKQLESITSDVRDFSKAFGKVDDSGAKTLLSSIQNIDKSLSELSQNILNVNKNMSNMGGNTSGAVKQVENIGNAYQDAAKEAEKLADAQSKIGQKTNISSGMKDAFPDKDISASVESATSSIKEENNALEQNTQKVKENTQAKEQNANVNFNGYDKRLDSYNGKLGKYQTTIDRFNDGGWTSSTYLENVQKVRDAVKEYETLLNELKSKDASLVTSDDISKLDNYEKKIKDTIATVTNMSASEKGYNFVSGQKELDKIHKLLAENSKMSSDAKSKIQAYYREIESGNPTMSLDKIHGEILKIYNAEVEAGRAGRTLWDTLKNSGFHQIAAQMAGMFGVYDVINGLKQVVSTIRELDTAYTEMRKVSDESAQSLKNFQKESFSTADSVGTTALAMQDATATWMRLGESLDDAKESAKDATVLLNVSEFDNIDEATDSLVAMSQAYKELDKMEIIDVLDKIGNEYSISTDELSTALKDSAAVLKTQGNDLAESVALITAGNAITQDASKTAGETLPERYRNIFYRTYLTARAA
mgnify:CR=1 FL=1